MRKSIDQELSATTTLHCRKRPAQQAPSHRRPCQQACKATAASAVKKTQSKTRLHCCVSSDSTCNVSPATCSQKLPRNFRMQNSRFSCTWRHATIAIVAGATVAMLYTHTIERRLADQRKQPGERTAARDCLHVACMCATLCSDADTFASPCAVLASCLVFDTETRFLACFTATDRS